MTTAIVIRTERGEWAINLVDRAGDLARVYNRRRFLTATGALGHVVRLLRKGHTPAFPSAFNDLAAAAVDEANAARRGRPAA